MKKVVLLHRQLIRADDRFLLTDTVRRLSTKVPKAKTKGFWRPPRDFTAFAKSIHSARREDLRRKLKTNEAVSSSLPCGIQLPAWRYLAPCSVVCVMLFLTLKLFRIANAGIRGFRIEKLEEQERFC